MISNVQVGSGKGAARWRPLTATSGQCATTTRPHGGLKTHDSTRSPTRQGDLPNGPFGEVLRGDLQQRSDGRAPGAGRLQSACINQGSESALSYPTPAPTPSAAVLRRTWRVAGCSSTGGAAITTQRADSRPRCPQDRALKTGLRRRLVCRGHGSSHRAGPRHVRGQLRGRYQRHGFAHGPVLPSDEDKPNASAVKVGGAAFGHGSQRTPWQIRLADRRAP